MAKKKTNPGLEKLKQINKVRKEEGLSAKAAAAKVKKKKS